MQCYKTVHQRYSIIDLPLSGGFSQWGKLVLLCLGDMASGRNVTWCFTPPVRLPSHHVPLPLSVFPPSHCNSPLGPTLPPCFSGHFLSDVLDLTGRSKRCHYWHHDTVWFGLCTYTFRPCIFWFPIYIWPRFNSPLQLQYYLELNSFYTAKIYSRTSWSCYIIILSYRDLQNGLMTWRVDTL